MRAGFGKVVITPPLGHVAQHRIRKGSPVPRTVVTTLAGPFIGYLPDQADFAAGGYASILTPRLLRVPPYAPAVGDVLVDSAVQLLRRLGDH